jgi:hypothetical protein
VEELALMLGSLSEISRLSAEELLRTVEEQHDLAKVDLSDE